MVLQFIGSKLKLNEGIEFAECGSLAFGGRNRQRSDILLLTEERIICVGHEFVITRQYMDREYISYPELADQTYLGSMDYLDWKQYEGGLLKWGFRTKQVEAVFSEVEYIIAKPRHFYGPLWVRIQRSDKLQTKRGNLKCGIKIAKTEDEDDKDYKSRHEELLARMKRLAGIAQN